MEARFDAHAAAVRRFYAQLSPAQQKAFDALGARAGGGPGMHMRMHERMRPGGAMHGGPERPPPER